MKGFKLYFYNNEGNAILFSYFIIDGTSNNTLTFDEQLEELENNQFNLNFSIMENINDEINTSFYKHLKVGAKLKLEYENNTGDDYVDFIITSISPEGRKENIKYNISATDYATFIFSRNNIGLNIDTMDSIEWTEQLESELTNQVYSSTTARTSNTINLDYTVYRVNSVVVDSTSIYYSDYNISGKSITFDSDIDINGVNVYINYDYTDKYLETLGNYLLKRGGLKNYSLSDGWSIVSNNSNIFNISLSNSNTYNALVEIANLTNTVFTINYLNKTITFYNIDDSIFYNNYRLSPNINLQDLSLDYSGEELYTTLFVSGGDDEYSSNVGLTPTLPEYFMSIDWDVIDDISLTDENLIEENYYSRIWADLEDYGAPTEEDIELTSLINKVPYLDNFILNLKYFLDNELITEANYVILFDKIYNVLRKINVKYQSFLKKKNRIEYYIYKTQNAIENYCEVLSEAEGEEHGEYSKKINDSFYYGVGGDEIKVSAASSEVSYNLEWKYSTDGTIFYSISSFTFPGYLRADVVINTSTYSGRALSFDNNGIGNIIITDGTEKYKINYIGTINYNQDVENNLISASITSKYKSISSKSFVLTSYLRYPNSEDYNPVDGISSAIIGEYIVGDLVLDEQTLKLYIVQESFGSYSSTSDTIAFDNGSFVFGSLNVIYNTTSISEYAYFGLLRYYKGYDYILEKINYYKEILIDYIIERDKLEIEIQELKTKLSSLTDDTTDEYINLSTQIVNKETNFGGLKEAVGTWTYDFDSETFGYDGVASEGGKYSLIWKKYNEFWTEYQSENTQPVPAETTLMDKYNSVKEEKEVLWYELKRDFGQYLLEGFYENGIETQPINLYNQGIIYMEKYKEPVDEYGISYLDISQIIGKEINNISVGDYINIFDYSFKLINQLNNELRVTAISRSLRSSSDISLTLDRIKNSQRLLEKLLLGL